MTLNTQTRSTEQVNPAYRAQTQSWKWEKKHWLLVIALACLVLFWFGSQMLEVSLVKQAIEWLPVLGTVAFASEKIIKLTQ